MCECVCVICQKLHSFLCSLEAPKSGVFLFCWNWIFVSVCVHGEQTRTWTFCTEKLPTAAENHDTSLITSWKRGNDKPAHVKNAERELHAESYSQVVHILDTFHGWNWLFCCNISLRVSDLKIENHSIINLLFILNVNTRVPVNFQPFLPRETNFWPDSFLLDVMNVMNLGQKK